MPSKCLNYVKLLGMFYKLFICIAIASPGSILAIDYSALKHKSILSSDRSIKASSLEIQYDKKGVGKNEKIQLFVNGLEFSNLTNKEKKIINVLPGTYYLEIKKNNALLDTSVKQAVSGQKLSWLIPHNKKAKEKPDVAISF